MWNFGSGVVVPGRNGLSDCGSPRKWADSTYRKMFRRVRSNPSSSSR
jgi:hypothetical protein